jgi:hypothetical protein
LSAHDLSGPQLSCPHEIIEELDVAALEIDVERAFLDGAAINLDGFLLLEMLTASSVRAPRRFVG